MVAAATGTPTGATAARMTSASPRRLRTFWNNLDSLRGPADMTALPIERGHRFRRAVGGNPTGGGGRSVTVARPCAGRPAALGSLRVSVARRYAEPISGVNEGFRRVQAWSPPQPHVATRLQHATLFRHRHQGRGTRPIGWGARYGYGTD